MKNLFMVTLLFIILNGCAVKTVVMDEETKSQLNGKTITYITQTHPKYPEVMTPLKSLGLTVGGFLGGIILGIDSTNMNKITIPGNYISQQIIPLFIEKYHMKYLKEIVPKKESYSNINSSNKEDISEFKQLKMDYKSDYLLDVQDYRWAVLHLNIFGGASYVVMLKTNIQLIDKEREEIITQTSCEYFPEDKEILPTYDEMFKNNGELFKKETMKGINLCIEKIKKDLF
jgi:hypothetical protein